mgnify:CR=1 FL=1|tara:strand:+ start:261 stop:509 length:249 start_codon:yes stop_codon:yes gene_type:complete
MNRLEILESIQLIFHNVFLDESIEISEQTSPEDIEEWDSLAHVTILTAIEAELNIQFTAEDMGECMDVRIIIDRVSKRLEED